MTRDRTEQLRRWIKVGPETETPVHEDVIMWGAWVSGIGDDEYHPPAALFQSEDAAKEFVMLSGAPEYDVSPCLLTITTRDNFEIPAPDAARTAP